MDKFTCVAMWKNDDGVVEAYTLMDLTGKKVRVGTNQLRMAIKFKDITVDNLEMTSKNELINLGVGV